MATHEVTNQPPPRVELDEYAENRALGEAMAAFGADWATEHLHRVGRHVGSAPFRQDAARAHRIPPTLGTHDRWGRRVDEVEYDPAYHRIIGAAVADGARTSAWAEPRPGAAVARAATFMLYAQVERGRSGVTPTPWGRSSRRSRPSAARTRCWTRTCPAPAR